jgi:hypothetical protein
MGLRTLRRRKNLYKSDYHVCSFESTHSKNMSLISRGVLLYIGDWSNGMTGVSKTLSGSSILSSPVLWLPEVLKYQSFWWLFYFLGIYVL